MAADVAASVTQMTLCIARRPLQVAGGKAFRLKQLRQAPPCCALRHPAHAEPTTGQARLEIALAAARAH
eukprot:1736702-Alexandrium_andersonii.AAC.1